MKGRLEDRRLLTGQGRFISDWNFPNQAYAAFLRSDRAHAEIVSVDAGSALDHPRVQGPLGRAAQKTAAPGARSRESPTRRRVRRLRGRRVAAARAGRGR